jgi:hypothetical protein
MDTSTTKATKEPKMYLHPDVMLDQFHSRQRELFAEADRSRLLATALRARRARRARHQARASSQ